MILRTTCLIAVASTLAACGGTKMTQLAVTQEQRAANSPSLCLLSPWVTAADGSITAAQMEAGIDASFAAADTNSDGKLTYDEINAWNQAKQGSCDSTSLVSWDGTGTIRRDEYGARYQTAFVSADRNGDGIATADELAAPVSATERAIADYKASQKRKASAASAKTDETPDGMPTRNSTSITSVTPPSGY